MRTLAIGDIHGCRDALVALMKAVKPTPDDRLVFIGDYIDRGPDSKGVIDWILKHRDKRETITLRGNHEIMMLDARRSKFDFSLWIPAGASETLTSYGVATEVGWIEQVPPEHWDFINQTRPWFETDTHIFVHAALIHDLDMNEQPDEVIYWNKFESMRLPHKSGKVVVCGHTRQSLGEIKTAGHAVCIDTAACKGQWLTCLDAESGDFWQSNERGETRKGNLRDLQSA
ncbi:MAG: serine/threonine protein phosphatase 1 [Limisphaerales bacterium]|jgi:serine/threonine protein phosphatase 1